MMLSYTGRRAEVHTEGPWQGLRGVIRRLCLPLKVLAERASFVRLRPVALMR